MASISLRFQHDLNGRSIACQCTVRVARPLEPMGYEFGQVADPRTGADLAGKLDLPDWLDLRAVAHRMALEQSAREYQIAKGAA